MSGHLWPDMPAGRSSVLFLFVSGGALQRRGAMILRSPAAAEADLRAGTCSQQGQAALPAALPVPAAQCRSGLAERGAGRER